MENNALWLTPLILLIGASLLIASTATRYGQIHAEFQQLRGQAKETQELYWHLLFKRSALFRNTSIALYVSLVLFACGSLLGGLVVLWLRDYAWAAMGLTCLGIAALVFAAIELIRESLLSAILMGRQNRRLDENGKVME